MSIILKIILNRNSVKNNIFFYTLLFTHFNVGCSLTIGGTSQEEEEGHDTPFNHGQQM